VQRHHQITKQRTIPHFTVQNEKESYCILDHLGKSENNPSSADLMLNWRCKKRTNFNPLPVNLACLALFLSIELILASAVLLCLPAFAMHCFCLPASGRRTCLQHSRADQ